MDVLYSISCTDVKVIKCITDFIEYCVVQYEVALSEEEVLEAYEIMLENIKVIQEII